MSTKYPDQTLSFKEGDVRSWKWPRHIPPVAYPIKPKDFVSAAVGLIKPKQTLVEFSDLISAEVGSDTCLLVGSGRSALSLILRSLARSRGGKDVLVPAYSCSTVLQSVLDAGLNPIFVDVSIDTLSFKRHDLIRRMEDRPLAIVGTHLYGLGIDFSEILSEAQERDIVFIEDAAQAFGVQIAGHSVGRQGDFGFFSLGRGKCLPVGEGGAIICKSEFLEQLQDEIEEQIKPKARIEFGWLLKLIVYSMVVTPFGWWWVNRSQMNPAAAGEDFDSLPGITHKNLLGIQAGIGASLLGRSGAVYQIWRNNAETLHACLAEFPFLQIPKAASVSQSVYLRFPIVIDSAERTERLFKKLEQIGIGVSRSYRFTLPKLYGQEGRYPGAEQLANCLLTLPTNHFLDAIALARIKTVFETEIVEPRR